MNFKKIRDQFPIANTILDDGKDTARKLIYFDHAASTHAPKPVLDSFLEVMESTYANVHRAEHTLSCLSTDMFEEVPNIMADFIGVPDLANSGSQIVLTSNTTSALDLASHVFAEKEGVVLTTLLEHHSNDLPYRHRGDVVHTHLLEDGSLDMDDFEKKLQDNNVKLVAVSAGSNVTGYMPPIFKIARMAHDNNAKILVDAAQRLAHFPIEVKPFDHPEHIDFLAAAGHKTYAPFGASFLFGNVEDFDNAVPYVPGGGTVSYVSETDVAYLKGPERHQFGTPNIGGSIAFAESLKFLKTIGIDKIREHEMELLVHMLDGLQNIENVELYGDIPLENKIAVVPFNITQTRHDVVANKLDNMAGIATRNGCFCAHPYLIHLLKVSEEDSNKLRDAVVNGTDPQLPGAVRASIGIYNTVEEVDIFLDTVEKIAKNSD
ncbi:MAG: aminotransferase class V-fold PLP-dependent enzyme [Candidatus Kariarchaeaceae archaeon]